MRLSRAGLCTAVNACASARPSFNAGLLSLLQHGPDGWVLRVGKTAHKRACELLASIGQQGGQDGGDEGEDEGEGGEERGMRLFRARIAPPGAEQYLKQLQELTSQQPAAVESPTAHAQTKSRSGRLQVKKQSKDYVM